MIPAAAATRRAALLGCIAYLAMQASAFPVGTNETAAPLQCSVPAYNRIECDTGTTHEPECLAAGCCYNRSTQGTFYCFKPSSGPATGGRSCEPTVNGIIGIKSDGGAGGIQIGFEHGVPNPEVCRTNCMNNPICTEWLYYKGCAANLCDTCTYSFLGELARQPDDDGVEYGGTCTGSPGTQAGCTADSCPFSFENYEGTTPNPKVKGRCGEVNAAERMPAGIWKDQSAVNNYVTATLEWYNVNGFKLKQQPCDRADRKPATGPPTSVAWTMPNLMRNTCDAVCNCVYPACPDVPDAPPDRWGTSRFCSLCGPKYNQPIEVQFWYNIYA